MYGAKCVAFARPSVVITYFLRNTHR